jgi:phosphoglycolate phosphatase/putative hydrolase of the HAD superfamily
MSTTNVYKAWLLDFDGTLYDARWVKVAMAAEIGLFGLSAARILRRFRHEHENVRRHPPRHGQTPFSLQIEGTARALGLPQAEVARIVDTWMFTRAGKYLRLCRRRGLLEEIVRFRATGGRTAIVSDYPVRFKLEALGETRLFDVIVASGEPGGPMRLKPAPDGYLSAAERLDLSAPECLVIGDRDEVDGAAARAAGMGFRLIR